jgi:acyl-CoA synthetase (AMP-forming)/AMP-acid ligase II
MGPTMYYGAARSLAAGDTRSVRHAVWGGMPPNNRATRALESVLPVPILGAFGMTEATSISYSTPEIYASGRIASCGYPISSMAFRVIGPDGEPLGPGRPGELQVRGAAGFTEYLNQPEQTAATLRDGWIHTGDGGWLDEDGALTVTGRISGMIISGNENIWPEEIETVIADMPGIEQVAVVGIPSDRWGQEVCAYVVADPGVTPRAVQEYCRPHIARYKVPKRVVLIDDLPKDPQGKVQKKLLVGRDRT